ncbi:MAG TPA: hypothetical protein VF695_01455 [Sphingomonas sp.]
MNPTLSGSDGRSLSIGLGLAVAICVILHLTFASTTLWTDELASEMFSRQPLSVLWSDWMRRETNPPLYYTLLKYWSLAIGGSDDALRALSLVIGAISVVACGLIVHSITRAPGCAIAAAIWTAGSMSHVYYSQEVRAYALAHLAVLLSLHCFVQIVRPREDRSPAWPIAYVVATSVVLYSHSTLILIPALYVIGFIVLAVRGAVERRTILLFLGANAVVLALYSWWMGIVLWQITNASNVDWIARPDLRGAAGMTMGAYHGPVTPFLLFALCALFLAASGSWAFRRSPVIIYALVAGGMPLLLFGISQFKPIMLDRTLYPASGAFLVCMALGLCRVRSARLRMAISVVVAACLLAPLMMHGRPLTREPWRDGIGLISRIDPRAVVVAENHAASLALARYCLKPACGLQVITPRRRDEGFTRGIPLPNSVMNYRVSPSDKRPIFILARVTPRHAPAFGRIIPGRAAPLLLDQGPMIGSPVKLFYSKP